MPDGWDAPPTAAPDAELWRRCAADDQGAFGVLFERHVRAVWNHAYRLTGSWAQAEDLTSSTFLTAWRRRSEVVLTRDSALPWLYTVAGNLARTERRGAGRWLRLLRRMPETGTVPDHADSVVADVDGAERIRVVLDAVRRLPPTSRRAVELCLLGEVSVADAAEQLGVAEATVRSQISRARTQLRGLLDATA